MRGNSLVQPFRNRIAVTAANITRLVLGVFFIVSAVAKLADMDTFELYIYSYHLLPLTWSFLVARLAVVAELLAGIGLLALRERFVDLLSLLMVIGYTLFLGYAMLVGRDDSCQCMGSLIEMNPTWSVVKNAALIVALLFAMHGRPWGIVPRWYVWLPALVAAFAVVFIISAPDNWLFGPEEELYDAEEFAKAIDEGGDLNALHLDQGRHAVAFLTPGCNMCRMTDTKLTHLFRRNELDSASLIYLTPESDTTVPPLTLDDTLFLRPCYKIPSMTFMLITYGQRPLLFLVEDGKVVGTCHSRNIEESQMVDFIPKQTI